MLAIGLHLDTVERLVLEQRPRAEQPRDGQHADDDAGVDDLRPDRDHRVCLRRRVEEDQHGELGEHDLVRREEALRARGGQRRQHEEDGEEVVRDAQQDDLRADRPAERREGALALAEAERLEPRRVELDVNLLVVVPPRQVQQPEHDDGRRDEARVGAGRDVAERRDELVERHHLWQVELDLKRRGEEGVGRVEDLGHHGVVGQVGGGADGRRAGAVERRHRDAVSAPRVRLGVPELAAEVGVAVAAAVAVGGAGAGARRGVARAAPRARDRQRLADGDLGGVVAVAQREGVALVGDAAVHRLLRRLLGARGLPHQQVRHHELEPRVARVNGALLGAAVDGLEPAPRLGQLDRQGEQDRLRRVLHLELRRTDAHRERRDGRRELLVDVARGRRRRARRRRVDDGLHVDRLGALQRLERRRHQEHRRRVSRARRGERGERRLHARRGRREDDLHLGDHLGRVGRVVVRGAARRRAVVRGHLAQLRLEEAERQRVVRRVGRRLLRVGVVRGVARVVEGGVGAVGVVGRVDERGLERREEREDLHLLDGQRERLGDDRDALALLEAGSERDRHLVDHRRHSVRCSVRYRPLTHVLLLLLLGIRRVCRVGRGVVVASVLLEGVYRVSHRRVDEVHERVNVLHLEREYSLRAVVVVVEVVENGSHRRQCVSRGGHRLLGLGLRGRLIDFSAVCGGRSVGA